MNDLLNQSMTDTVNLTPIEIALGIDAEGMTTARKLYEFLEMNKAVFSRWAKTNIEDNEFYEENKDWWGFNIVLNGNECRDYKLSTDFAKHLSMSSHSAKGKIARDYYVSVEDGAKKMVLQFQDMSPQLQYMIKVEQEQKRQAQEIEAVSSRVDSIREVVALDTTSWREDTRNLINKIAQELGGGQAFQQVRAESYELLEKRMGVSLKQRLTNKRRRMAEEGVCKSKRDKLSQVDIISEDKKLIEGYTAIVKEMAIRYGAA